MAPEHAQPLSVAEPDPILLQEAIEAAGDGRAEALAAAQSILDQHEREMQEACWARVDAVLREFGFTIHIESRLVLRRVGR